MGRVGLKTRADPPRWLRGPATVEGDWIVLDASRAEPYELVGQSMLFADLAAIRRRPEAVDFVQRYGLLWHGVGATAFRERWSEWQSTAGHLTNILLVNRSLQRAMRGEREYREELWQAWRQWEPEMRALFDDFPTTDHDLFAQASVWIEAGINMGIANEGVAEVMARVATAGPGDFRLAPRPQHLLSYAYFQVAQQVIGHVPMDICPECERFFPIADRRQQYCSPRCATRVRRRRWAERHTTPAEA